MKKIALATFTLLVSACSNMMLDEEITPTKADFVGEWACTMNGVAGTSNKVKLSENGRATYVGNVMLPSGNPLFNYTMERSGRWTAKNNTLTYTFTKGKVSRSHADEVLSVLKVQEEQNRLEKQYFNALRQQVNKSTDINLTVSNFTKKRFNIEQKVSGATRSGSCVRVL